jgi:hypothetical protein
MALINILRMIEASEGIPATSDADQKVLVTARINEAAKELYEDQDFNEAKREDIFNIDVASQVIALPWYVEYIRGWRFFNSRLPGVVDTKDNRYNEGHGNETWYQKWRSKGFSPLMREISNESTLTFTIPEPEQEDITINIIGATALASKNQETVVIPAGSLSVESVGNYTKVNNIIKSAPCGFDITVTDAEDNVMSIIPNHRTYALYHIIQIFDWDNMYLTSTSAQVEILYKEKFNELVNDYDEFLFGDKYDKAIYWKYLAHQSKDQAVTQAFEEKCFGVLQKIADNESIGLRRVMNFRKSPYMKMPYGQPFGPKRLG